MINISPPGSIAVRQKNSDRHTGIFADGQDSGLLVSQLFGLLGRQRTGGRRRRGRISGDVRIVPRWNDNVFRGHSGLSLTGGLDGRVSLCRWNGSLPVTTGMGNSRLRIRTGSSVAA